ncbi:hypothetical protein K439DRAFT_1612932 [Ramaria rubella]|nr:hypothetical protein K439DRAFT_1612932 [Ramaria rubella]
MFFDYEEEVTSNDGDIWLKSLDPLELLKHGWLLKKYDKPPMMMLIQSCGVDIGTEVGFRLQGILVDIKLPPIHVLEKNIRGMRQYVTITGLDQVVFKKNLMAIYALHDIYAKCFGRLLLTKTTQPYHSPLDNYPQDLMVTQWPLVN